MSHTTITTSAPSTAGPAVRRSRNPRLVALAGGIAAASVLCASTLASEADAATAAWNSRTTGDCTVSAILDRTGNSVTASAQMPCRLRHSSTTVRAHVQLWWGTYWLNWSSSASVTFANSFGTGDKIQRTTVTLFPACAYYRAVAAGASSGVTAQTVETPYVRLCA